jgi:hypothetical protein
MSQFRNLWDGIKFGAFMLGGAIIANTFPVIGSHPEDTVRSLALCSIAGAIAGGFAWQFFKALRDWPKPPA